MAEWCPDINKHTAPLGKMQAWEVGRLFGGLPRSWLQMVQDAPVLLRRLFAASISAQGLAWVTLARVVICLLTTVCKWLHSGGGSQPHPARFVFCLEIRK